MSNKSLYLSEKRYRELPLSTRKKLCLALGGRKNVTRRYVCNILNDLNARGEFEVAHKFEEDLSYLNYSTEYIY